MSAPITPQDMDQLSSSIRSVILDTLPNLDCFQYQEPKFENYFKNEIYHSFANIEYEVFSEVYDTILERVVRDSNYVWRSFKTEHHVFDYEDSRYEDRIEALKLMPQPQQRTSEWHAFRKNHLTGSNSWKIFFSEATRNQLRFEKLEPKSSNNDVRPNLNDQLPMNWGHKYEPVSIFLYEFYNDVTVEEFGCIEHETINCLAASPDGIVTSLKNNGRMIEVKNPTTREITQIPKFDYYIQMQLQMEVCDLNECDFVETKFKEYENREEFNNDKYRLEKGMLIVLIKNNLDLVYEYAPLFSNKPKELDEFVNKIYEKYNLNNILLQNGEYKWFKNIYWKLDKFSCVMVPRNPKWFTVARHKINIFWDQVIQDRKITDSYLKYKPKSRSIIIKPAHL